MRLVFLSIFILLITTNSVAQKKTSYIGLDYTQIFFGGLSTDANLANKVEDVRSGNTKNIYLTFSPSFYWVDSLNNVKQILAQVSFVDKRTYSEREVLNELASLNNIVKGYSFQVGYYQGKQYSFGSDQFFFQGLYGGSVEYSINNLYSSTSELFINDILTSKTEAIRTEPAVYSIYAGLRPGIYFKKKRFVAGFGVPISAVTSFSSGNIEVKNSTVNFNPNSETTSNDISSINRVNFSISTAMFFEIRFEL